MTASLLKEGVRDAANKEEERRRKVMDYVTSRMATTTTFSSPAHKLPCHPPVEAEALLCN